MSGKESPRKRHANRQVLRVLKLLLLLTALPLPALAAGEKTFEGRTDVVQIQVPVHVLTRDGQPVAGLGVESFRVFDQGKEQEVVGFEVVDLRNVDAGTDREALPAVARRNFLLLFDFTWSGSSSIMKARRAAHDFVLHALHPSDLVAIATHSLEFGPRLVVTFTPDRAQLARAIDTLGLVRHPGQGRQRVDPLRFIVETSSSSLGASQGDGQMTSLRGIGQDRAADDLDTLRAIGKRIEDSHKSYERSRITSWTQELAALAKSLNAIAGRKQVIYFSEGFDSELVFGRRPVSEGFEYEQEMLERVKGRLWMINGDDIHGNIGVQNDLEEMLIEFRRADCVIHPVDIAGLRSEGSASLARSVGSDGMFVMANKTGGQLFEASNDLAGQLEQMLDRSLVTYILSFQPKDLAFDGKYHRLKVQLPGMKGVKLSHRAGYYAPQPFAGLHPLEKSLLASDAIASATPREEVGLDVLAAPFRAGDELAYVPIILEIRGSDLLVDHPPREPLNVEIYAYVTNSRGEMVDYFSQTAQFDTTLHTKKIASAGVKYYGHMQLASGEYLLRTLVRNATTGRTGVKAYPISVPVYTREEATLLPPFFMDRPADRWLLLRDFREGRSDTVVYPFTINGEPFVPAARAVLRKNQQVELCLMSYNLGDGEPRIEGRVLDQEGEIRGGELRLKERTVTGIHGFDKMMLSFKPQGNLRQGDYTLEIDVTDPQTGARTTGRIPFFVGK